MAALRLGFVESPSGKQFEVRWDQSSHELYVQGELIGEADGPIEAVLIAEDFVRDK